MRLVITDETRKIFRIMDRKKTSFTEAEKIYKKEEKERQAEEKRTRQAFLDDFDWEYVY